MIVIVNYKMGNLRSIQYKLQKENFDCKISSYHEDISNADKLILPGVGHFKKAMQNLNDLNLIDILNQKVIKGKTPIMGICLGFQLFSNFSEEGDAEGLGWIDAETIKFNFQDSSKPLPVPHVGWDSIKIKKPSAYFDSFTPGQKFYFVHSYHMKCNHKNDILATTEYGFEFVSAIQRKNIFGTQFHPEKSHKKGFDIIKRFALS